MNFPIIDDLILNIVGVVVLSYVILNLFYKVFELKWPELYFSINDKTALFVSVSWQRYVVFRFVPFFITTTFSAGTFMRNYDNAEIIQATLASAVAYGLLTDGRAIYNILTRSSGIKTYFNAWFQVLLHIITLVLFLFVGYISGLVAKTYFIKAITPSVQGLIDNLWSSLLVVLLAFYLKDIYSQEGLSEDVIFRRSLENISPKVLSLIDVYSSKENANPILMNAICIAENLQRPPWVRKIESVLSVLKTEGTYGIMQVKSKKHLSDIESVPIAISQFFKDSAGITDVDRLRQIIANYNKDGGYIDIVLKIMSFLDYPSVEYRR